MNRRIRRLRKNCIFGWDMVPKGEWLLVDQSSPKHQGNSYPVWMSIFNTHQGLGLWKGRFSFYLSAGCCAGSGWPAIPGSRPLFCCPPRWTSSCKSWRMTAPTAVGARSACRSPNCFLKARRDEIKEPVASWEEGRRISCLNRRCDMLQHRWTWDVWKDIQQRGVIKKKCLEDEKQNQEGIYSLQTTREEKKKNNKVWQMLMWGNQQCINSTAKHSWLLKANWYLHDCTAEGSLATLNTDRNCCNVTIFYLKLLFFFPLLDSWFLYGKSLTYCQKLWRHAYTHITKKTSGVYQKWTWIKSATCQRRFLLIPPDRFLKSLKGVFPQAKIKKSSKRMFILQRQLPVRVSELLLVAITAVAAAGGSLLWGIPSSRLWRLRKLPVRLLSRLSFLGLSLAGMPPRLTWAGESAAVSPLV